MIMAFMQLLLHEFWSMGFTISLDTELNTGIKNSNAYKVMLKFSNSFVMFSIIFGMYPKFKTLEISFREDSNPIFVTLQS